MNIKAFFRGETSNKTNTISIVSNIVFLIASVWLAIILYDGFNLGGYQISELDNPNRNPIGYVVFKIGFIIAGLWMVLNSQNMRNRVNRFNKILGNIMGVFLLMSGLGMVVVAFSPIRVSYPMHIVGAILGFGGLFIALFFSFIILILKLAKEKNWWNILYGLIFYGPFFVVIVLGIFDAGIPLLKSLADGIPFGDFVPEGWEYYEWGMFFTGIFSTIGTHFLFSRREE